MLNRYPKASIYQGYFQGFLNDKVMQIAIALALLLHVGLLLITFSAPSDADASMRDVTVAVHLDNNSKAPEKPDFLATSNQIGSGIIEAAKRLSNPDTSEETDVKMNVVNPNQTTEAAQQEQVETSDHQIITTTLSWEQREREKGKKTPKKGKQSPDTVNSTAAMIATLEAEYSQHKQEFSKKSNVHTVDSVSAEADKSASYINAFRQVVEKMGNRHYPDEAREQHLAGDVRLMVVVEPTGRVRAIRVLHSSGSKVLDEAAKASVRYGAPYNKFDNDMRTYTELRIIRTWRFTPETKGPEVVM